MRPTSPLLLSLLVVLGLGASAFAQQPAQPSAAEAKLREGLRNTMLQLRTIQGERDALQVDKTTLENEKTELTTKLDALTKQAAANQETAQKSISELETKVTAHEAEITQLKAALDKWQKSQREAIDLATKKEGERAKAAARIIELDRQVEDQQRKNAAMYKVGIEVLNRYEKFVLGDAIAAREPFTGIARVKFQTLAQDFRDQINDERIKPAPPKPSEKPEQPKAEAKPAAKKGDSKPAAAPATPSAKKPAFKTNPEKATAQSSQS